MTTGSTVNAALAALVLILQQATPQGITVVDGINYDAEGNYLAVGWDRSDNPGVSVTRSSNSAGMAGGFEIYEVSCLLALADGGGTVPSVRTAAYQAFDAYALALQNSRNLGGAVATAQLTDHDYTPYLGEVGPAVDLRFTVEIKAFPI